MKMRARSLVLSVLVSGMMLMSAPSAHGRQPRGRDRPNIVFIISDDHRWDALGAAGNPQIKTPVLDRLAREGVYFRQATIHVSQCAPSRATLLTGLPPHQSGYYANNFLRPDLRPVLSGSSKHGIDFAISEWADTESQFRHYTHRLIRTPRYKLVHMKVRKIE